MSGTVNVDQFSIIKKFEDDDKSTMIHIGVVRLFTANSLKWSYSGLNGGLCLTIDRKLKGAPLFRLYDLNSFEILFQVELYYNFHKYYQELNDHFHSFPIKGNFLIGRPNKKK